MAVPVPEVQPFQPGKFYRREQPCLLALLKGVAQVHTLDAVVINGYVTLETGGRAGLGAHLFEALGQQIPVIGMAKAAFQGSDHALAVTRGGSLSPLFVTAVGTDTAQAAAWTAHMAGPHRLPTLLNRAAPTPSAAINRQKMRKAGTVDPMPARPFPSALLLNAAHSQVAGPQVVRPLVVRAPLDPA